MRIENFPGMSLLLKSINLIKIKRGKYINLLRNVKLKFKKKIPFFADIDAKPNIIKEFSVKRNS